VGSFVQIFRSQPALIWWRGLGSAWLPVGSFVQIFFARLDVFGDGLGFGLSSGPECSRQGQEEQSGARKWLAADEQELRKQRDQPESNPVCRKTSWPNVQDGPGLRWSEPGE